MLAHNETYRSRGWVLTDPEIILIEPDNNLYYWIEKISNLLAGSKPLFLIDDVIADEALEKRCQPLLELAISRRHRALPFPSISGDNQKCFTFGTQKTEQI